MASIASQIILHPAVSESLKFGGTTLGRDKVSNPQDCSTPIFDNRIRPTGLSNTLRVSTPGILLIRVTKPKLHDGPD
jgi:hypothetical protein